MTRFNPQYVWSGSVNLSSLLIELNSREFYLYSQKRKGYIYAIQHPSIANALKIGRTAKSPFIRAKTLGTAGVLGNFDVIWCAEFINASWAEQQVHKLLKGHHREKEFFNISVEMAKESINSIHRLESTILEKLSRDLLFNNSYDEWVDSLDSLSLLDSV